MLIDDEFGAKTISRELAFLAVHAVDTGVLGRGFEVGDAGAAWDFLGFATNSLIETALAAGLGDERMADEHATVLLEVAGAAVVFLTLTVGEVRT